MNKLISLLLLSLLPTLAMAEWPKLDMPDDARIGTLGDHMKMNGIPTQVYGLQFKQDIKQMKAFYKTELRKFKAVDPVETPLADGGVMLFQNDGHYLYTVNLAPQTSNSSTATIIISDPNNAKITEYEFQLPLDSQVLSDVESVDNGQYSRHLTLNSSATYDKFKREMLNRMAKVGYAVEPDMYEKIKGKKIEVYYLSGPKRDAKFTVSDSPTGVFAELIMVHLR